VPTDFYKALDAGLSISLDTQDFNYYIYEQVKSAIRPRKI
jgi:hypothetical protein